MKDSTIRLLLAGILTLAGLTAMLATVLTGMVADYGVQDVVTLALLFSNAVTLGTAFFVGTHNGMNRSNGG